MVVSNLVFCGQLFPHKALEDFIPIATKFYDHRPRMIKFASCGITILVFTSLRFRLMGKGENHLSVLSEFLTLAKVEARNVTLTTMTITHRIPYQINLHKLDPRHFYMDSELFPAARWIHDGRENFNIFHSGSIVITGVKDIYNLESQLIPKLLSQLKNARYR